MKTYQIEENTLRSFTERIFLKIGCSESDAIQAADVLIASDLRGIDSHGVARLSGYIRLWEKKRINVSPKLSIIHETLSTATVNGDSALGLISAPFAMRIAISKAKECGTGWVAVKNSNHFGIAAYHAMKALEEDMIGIAMTNASPLVAPTHTTERLLGTNPMCYAFPARSSWPIIVDMATAAAANGKLEIAQRLNEDIPEGWVQTKDGRTTNDPHGLKSGGSLLPLGSDKEHGSHKGYGLGAVVDILTAVLSGANYGPWVPPFVAFLDPLPDLPGQGIGHFFGAMRVDAFRPAEDFKANIDRWIQRFKSAKPIDESQPVIIPGEPEFKTELVRKKEGIPLTEMVVEDLKELARHLQTTHPF